MNTSFCLSSGCPRSFVARDPWAHVDSFGKANFNKTLISVRTSLKSKPPSVTRSSASSVSSTEGICLFYLYLNDALCNCHWATLFALQRGQSTCSLEMVCVNLGCPLSVEEQNCGLFLEAAPLWPSGRNVLYISKPTA